MAGPGFWAADYRPLILSAAGAAAEGPARRFISDDLLHLRPPGHATLCALR